uniref:Calpain catalytic domain-containing protein n=1 Tax=Denticeps clupeoides TaxID=299321 RepID=A0AAY4ASU5_9TELE
RVALRAEGHAPFEDADFPAQDSSLFSDLATPISALRGEIAWLRPQEICQTPRLFPDDSAQAHAKQGVLGDCWLLCACSMLLQNDHLMRKVIPPDQPQWGEWGYRGAFLFNFWQRGTWVEVKVDDRLPCINSKPCFSRCLSPAAFWVALLEKAYAKLRGSYECLWAGQVCEALVDLSGGVAERWKLRGSRDEEEEEEEKAEKGSDDRPLTLRNLPQLARDGCALSCSVYSSSRGVGELGQYHAMSMVDWREVRTVSGQTKCLLKIKNPWGRRCWDGVWAENGAGWKNLETSCARDLLGQAEQGEFWVDATEMQKDFDEVTVGYPISGNGHVQSIYTGAALPYSQHLTGHWVKGHSAGGCRNNSSYSSNPKFWLKASEVGEVLVCLLQHSTARDSGQRGVKVPAADSTLNHPHYQAIGLHMWKVEKKHFNLSQTLSKPPCACTATHAYEREVVLRAQLGAGFYLIVPSTFQKGAQGSFLLRVYSSSPTALSAMKVRDPALPNDVEGEWESTSCHGSWVPGLSAGGSRNFSSHSQNPRHPLTVTYDPGGTNIRVTLRQNCPPSAFQAIGFHVYKVRESQDEPMALTDMDPVASCVPHCYTHEVTLDCSLQAGAYAVIPSTYHPDLAGEFTLTWARRIPRKVVKSQEQLGQVIQEVSTVFFFCTSTELTYSFQKFGHIFSFNVFSLFS